MQEILKKKDELSLSALVRVSNALGFLGLREALFNVTSLALESASFLTFDAVTSLAKTLAVSGSGRWEGRYVNSFLVVSHFCASLSLSCCEFECALHSVSFIVIHSFIHSFINSCQSTSRCTNAFAYILVVPQNRVPFVMVVDGR